MPDRRMIESYVCRHYGEPASPETAATTSACSNCGKPWQPATRVNGRSVTGVVDLVGIRERLIATLSELAHTDVSARLLAHDVPALFGLIGELSTAIAALDGPLNTDRAFVRAGGWYAGRDALWITDRSGHTTFGMLRTYERDVRRWRELGDAPVDAATAIPEFAAANAAAKRGRNSGEASATKRARSRKDEGIVASAPTDQKRYSRPPPMIHAFEWYVPPLT